MIAEVWHATEDRFFEDASEHVHVADVELPNDMDVIDALEKAYMLTNHINIPWEENQNVTRCDEEKHRSTSVGDIIKINGKSWRVLMIGWSEPF